MISKRRRKKLIPLIKEYLQDIGLVRYQKLEIIIIEVGTGTNIFDVENGSSSYDKKVRQHYHLTLMYEQGSGAPTRPTDVSSYSENVPPAHVSVRPYPCPIGAL
jgi:hypothetical protein